MLNMPKNEKFFLKKMDDSSELNEKQTCLHMC